MANSESYSLMLDFQALNLTLNWLGIFSNLCNLYNLHFLPYLTYCSTIWGQMSKQLRSKIAVVQKRVLKTILHVERWTSSKWVNTNTKTLPRSIHDFQILVLMYKHLNNLLPDALHNLFILCENFVTRLMWNTDTYHVPYMWLSASMNIVLCRRPKLQNGLLQHSREDLNYT